jgi:hypothetical protein
MRTMYQYTPLKKQRCLTPECYGTTNEYGLCISCGHTSVATEVVGYCATDFELPDTDTFIDALKKERE